VKSFARNVVGSIAALAIILILPLAASAQNTGIAVTLDGNALDLSPAPIIDAGRVFVPLRGVFEDLGASVVYANGTINATGNGRDIALQIGSTQATVNGQPQTLDVAPFIVGASTFVPLRFVSEALGASVNWDETQRLVAIETPGGASSGSDVAPTVSDDAFNDEYTDSAPPPIPVYNQPDVPAPNDIWQPGYWAWGAYGYYWVPGTWVQAPQPGYLWTPGYWHYDNDHHRYAWSQGYWATAVGFYGGVNYGAGYFGIGYVGGRWLDRAFHYNTYVSHVNVTIVHNVYVDRTVSVNHETTRISYNGGPSGLRAQPTAHDRQIESAHHLDLTETQRQHIATAAQDRSLLARVNHNRPPVTAVAAPLTVKRHPASFTPVRSTDRVVPVVHPMPPRPVPPAYHPSANHRPAPRPVAPRKPEARPAPERHEQPRKPTPRETHTPEPH
jgi:hypothetical protein